MINTIDKNQADQESVLIIGGGVIGVASAHYLQQQGYQVTVIDQSKIGSGSSYANCGYICPSHVLPLAEPGMVMVGIKSLLNPKAPFKIKPQWRFSLYQWLFQFSRRCNHQQMIEGGHHLQTILNESKTEYEKLFADQSFKAQWKKTGLLYVLKSQQGVDSFAETDQLTAEYFDLQASYIDGADLPSFDAALKSGLAGGYWYENDATVEPAELVNNWVKKLSAHGVQFRENCKLLQLNKNNHRITGVITNQGELKADHFVFATGAWSRLLAKELDCHIPVEPCKGYSVTIDRPEICPQIPMLFPEHRVGITPFECSFRLGSMMEFSGYDQSISQHRIDQLYQSASPYLNSTLSSENQRPWYGWRPMTWDSLPIIGHVPKLNNALLATGHNMLGMTLAPATGKLVAELLSRQVPTIDPEPFSPIRF